MCVPENSDKVTSTSYIFHVLLRRVVSCCKCATSFGATEHQTILLTAVQNKFLNVVLVCKLEIVLECAGKDPVVEKQTTAPEGQ